MICETWFSALGMDVLLHKDCLLILCIIWVYVSYLGLDVRLLLGSIRLPFKISFQLSLLCFRLLESASLGWCMTDLLTRPSPSLWRPRARRDRDSAPEASQCGSTRQQVEEWVSCLKPRTQHVLLWSSRLLLQHWMWTFISDIIIAKRKPQDLEPLL